MQVNCVKLAAFARIGDRQLTAKYCEDGVTCRRLLLAPVAEVGATIAVNRSSSK